MTGRAGSGRACPPGGDIVATARRAAGWLHRDRFVPVTGQPRDLVPSRDDAVPRCEAHGVPHTGKLARSIILDLAVHDDLAPHDPVAEASWHRAVTRARWVVGRLGPDPDHGGLVFLLPGSYQQIRLVATAGGRKGELSEEHFFSGE